VRPRRTHKQGRSGDRHFKGLGKGSWNVSLCHFAATCSLTLSRFLLVRLTMEQLKAQETPNKLKEALESLPSDLYKMYELTIARSPNPERTFRLLCWVFMAMRRLSPGELVHAMAWRLEATAPLDDQDLEGEGRLLSSCGGLVEFQQDEVVFIRKLL
jgi:hypothetical protein